MRFVTGATLALCACASVEAEPGTDAVGDTKDPSATGPSADSEGQGAADSGSAGFSADDGGTAPAEAPRYGLCNVGKGAECDPDDDGLRSSHRADVGRCDTSWADAGAGADANLDAEDAAAQRKAITGCRLTSEAMNGIPQCLPANPSGSDGSRCESGDDCAPGFDCVEGAKGPVCRRYCCAGTCEGTLTQAGSPTFCDVKRLLDADRLAPVCVPLKRCTLLDEASCSGDETCAITETGAAACVPEGKLAEGASCEADHCARGLTCLGAPGSRKCYELCRVAKDTCGEGRTCKTSALFKDPQVGVCGGL